MIANKGIRNTLRIFQNAVVIIISARNSCCIPFSRLRVREPLHSYTPSICSVTYISHSIKTTTHYSIISRKDKQEI